MAGTGKKGGGKSGGAGKDGTSNDGAGKDRSAGGGTKDTPGKDASGRKLGSSPALKAGARGRGAGARQRVKTGRGRTASSVRWLERQLNDPYVRRAQAEGYRSRAAYKLIELDEKYGFLKGARAIVDLGIAPGGWSQVARRRSAKVAIVGIDLLPCDAIDDVTMLQMDFMADDAPDAILTALGRAPDLILSDMAANTVGHPATDHLRTMMLAEAAADFAIRTLEPGGAFVSKVFSGGSSRELLTMLQRNFITVKHAKPPASRKGSPELFVVAQGFKGKPA